MDAKARAAAWELQQPPECVADVPLQIKEDLAEGHFEPDRPPGQRGLLELAAARILVDFDASPHGGPWRPLPDSGREPAIAMASQPEEDDDLTREQARQLKAVYDALIVPGTTSPEQTVNLMFERIRAVEEAMTVPGTTTAEEAFNLLFARVRRIEGLVEELQAQPSGAAGVEIDYDRLADKVAERLAGRLAE